MFEWVKKFFGSGKLRFEVEDVNGKVREGTAPFVGSFESEEELLSALVDDLIVEQGIKVKRIRIIGVKGETRGDCNSLSGKWYSRSS